MRSAHTASPAGAAKRRFAAVQRIVGLLLMGFSTTMLPPVAVDLFYGENTWPAYLIAAALTLLAGLIIWWPVRNYRGELKVREGFLIVVLFWVVLSAFGAIPLYLTHSAWHSLTDALFESISGLTATGATTVAAGLDLMPHATLYYRSQLHWFGGMGIVVLAVAVLPMLGVGGMQLYRAETPGPMKDTKLTPRITSSARALWTIYVLLTLSCALAYRLLGMSSFDAICHAMSTVSTGGFSTHDASIGYFHSLGIEIAAMLFMLAGASNFALHFLAWEQRSLRLYLRNAEFRAFLLLYLVLGVIVCGLLYAAGTYGSLGESVRKGLFQVIAYGTDAGFATADPSHWPHFLPLLLVLATFMGSCAGSTGGGVKVIRLVLFGKQASREIARLIHPSAELPIKLENKIVPDAVVYAIGGFFSVYIAITLLLSFAMVFTGLDPVTAFSAVAGAINNGGPGLNSVVANVASVSEIGKWILIVAMLMGRLEVFTLLVIFTPSFWRR
ncbi:trk system potassium uptake protein TrkH [Solimonas aquatica]|uniref:Trk system potassium uptake protein n=1 Tax=Solimonas aquatica TaxID=489703 RepID=A0A1H9F3K2_9GAMM|nr:TrkH family potassium uptake protein [Solimonas aquatica]SEQ32439.1 trk system potassium uptake protein TrkH [Solimonas aquatica]